MTLRRCLTLVAMSAGIWGWLGTSPASAQAPGADPVARQRFVALLTSVKPKSANPGKASAALTPRGSLKAFGGQPPGTPVKLPGRH
jgi:hypothetical protein